MNLMNWTASPRLHQSEIRGAASAIVALPLEVVAQIKSSATITNLAFAILGLVQNSLDARASKITIDVDFKRGGCVVEDNGLGILPTEFDENGGLGKIYHTSKYKISEANYGCNGIFLYSLASLCLLNITSHHHEHRSTNSLTFHLSKPISRLVPAPASHTLESRDHGTKVTVRDLFGNMPVRVKQRYVASEDKTEQDRLWASLKQSIVSLFIASGRLCNLRLRDTSTSKSFKLSVPRERNILEFGPAPPEKLRMALSMLQQAGMVSAGSIGSWIPASASSRSVVIKGGICLEPAPSKSTQFLSLGMNPLSRSGYNELYDHINRLFSRSRFGVVEEEPLTEQERSRRQHDRRFKQDGLTNKQLLAEKGVDRWPMFVLTISFKQSGSRYGPQTLDGEVRLASVIAVLDALVNGWLASNLFRPQKRKATEKDSFSATTMPEISAKKEASLGNTQTLNDQSKHRAASRQSSTSPTRPYTGVSSMNELSRIKSGNRSLLETGRPYTPGSKRPRTAPDLVPRFQSNTRDDSTKRAETSLDKLTRISEMGRNDIQFNSAAEKGLYLHTSLLDPEGGNATIEDQVMDWIDPITKQNHRINSRTGAIVAPEPRKGGSNFERSGMQDQKSRNIFAQSLRLPARTELEDTPIENKWLEGVLKDWRNPVFRCAEKSIQQASLHVPGENTGAVTTGKFNLTTTAQIDQAFREVSHLNASKITKDALRHAKVISQVDEKFILVALNASKEAKASYNAQRITLVMIDQHAADERIKVEQLLRDLSQPPSDAESMYQNSLGHASRINTSLLVKHLTFRSPAREVEYFRNHAARFAEWGILYDLPHQLKENKERDSDIIVRCLPPVIAERCKSDPKLLINLLRSELWKLVDSSLTSSSSSRTKTSAALTTTDGEDDKHDWLKTIGSLPQGILDMVNSRACRSAIMFNDALTKEACEELVRELAKCKFPFLCAHGRPSMVPLLDLGGVGVGKRDDALGFDTAGAKTKRTFGEAFGSWKKTRGA